MEKNSCRGFFMEKNPLAGIYTKGNFLPNPAKGWVLGWSHSGFFSIKPLPLWAFMEKNPVAG